MPALLSFEHPDGGTVTTSDGGWFHDDTPIYLALTLAACARSDGDHLAAEKFRNEQVVPAHRAMIEQADPVERVALVAELQDAATPLCDCDLAAAKGLALHSARVYRARGTLPRPMREFPRGETQSFAVWSPRQVEDWLAGRLSGGRRAA